MQRFIADAMLGRLARWLRLLGFDTIYYTDITDALLLKIAKQDERIILTRDTHFLKRNIRDLLFINSDDVFKQLTQVIKTFHLRMPEASRCVNCNGILHEVNKEDVADSVPEHVYLNFSLFEKCSECGSVYWQGSHLKNFRERIKGIMKEG